jgi:hypothetical protein
MQHNELKIVQFADWIISISDGTIPTERGREECEASWITIPDDFLIHTDGNKIATLVAEVFLDFVVNYKNPEYLATRAIVCPNNQDVDAINDYIVNLIYLNHLSIYQILMCCTQPNF